MQHPSFRKLLLSRTAQPLEDSSSSLGTLITIVRRAGLVKMRCADVVESQNFLLTKCSPLASDASTEHDLEAFQWGSCCKRAARVFWCQLAHSLGFLRYQPCPGEWIRGITLVRVDPSCPGGCQSRLVQTAHRNFMVNSQFTHEHQLFLDGVSHQLGVKWQSSDFIFFSTASQVVTVSQQGQLKSAGPRARC